MEQKERRMEEGDSREKDGSIEHGKCHTTWLTLLFRMPNLPFLKRLSI